MKLRVASQNYFQLIRIITLGLGAGVLLAGCGDRKPRALDSKPDPQGPPPLTRESVSPSQPLPAPVQPKSSATPQAPAVENQAPIDPAALAKQFRATAEPQKRGELVDEIWKLDTPAAVDTLRQLFLTERELDVKVDIIAGLSDSKRPETRESRFGLALMALAPGQPKNIRELAAQMLVDFDDPRAVSLLQQFAQDADPDMREAAKEALETRRAIDQQ